MFLFCSDINNTEQQGFEVNTFFRSRLARKRVANGVIVPNFRSRKTSALNTNRSRMLPMLSWILFVVSAGQSAGHKGGPITCECSTAQCAEQNTTVCTTEGLCFTQFLDRGIGIPTLLRGCTEGRTPILCENRKPSRAKNWPLLHCCDEDFCNRHAIPTPPERLLGRNNLEDSRISTNCSGNGPRRDSVLSSRVSSFQKTLWPHIVSPVYISILVLGITSLVFIGIVAAILIRRSNRFYADRYGALEFQVGKIPTRCDYDSEADSLGSSQRYLHAAFANRNT